ncbi:MAG: CapA family protein [Anaerolineae bacterium]
MHCFARTRFVLLILSLLGWLAPFSTYAQPNLVTLIAVGDIMLARALQQAARATNDPRYPFQNTYYFLHNADVTVGNLECVISDKGEPLRRKQFTFRAEPFMLEGLQWAGFDVLSLANNHSMDYGAEAMLDMRQRLDAAHIMPVGAGKNEAEAFAPALVTVKGVKIAFIGVVNVPKSGTITFDTAITAATVDQPGVAWITEDADGLHKLTQSVMQAKQKADVVIVLLHSGWEFIHTPSDLQKRLSRAAIDAGAAAVIGSHPHVLQGVENYNGGVIAYSLGNFAFDMEVNLTALLELKLDSRGIHELHWHPMTIDRTGRPQIAYPAAKARILRQLEQFSAALR